ncbi:MAG: type VI secretion system ImpA family N-terminal domain-containing protein [Planctomycetes bacterium]|nr:type VI secretion system ImpA family N-terminal domain-containing protein [Planctomycetota bacterium]
MPLLDFEALTAPIPGEQPAGVRLPPDVRKKMEDARKEFEPNPDDPSQPPIPKKPEWGTIVNLATNSLASSSKDLLAAVRLVEALTKQESFAGLQDGIHLLRLLLTDCWDRVHPLIEEPDDLEYRTGPIQWLCDRESGAWFPIAVEKLPLLRINGKVVCLADCKAGQIDGESLTADAIRNGEPVSDTIKAEIEACLTEINELDQALGEKMAEHAPAFGGLKDVIVECKRYLDHLRGPATDDDGGGEEPAQESGGETTGAKKTGGGASRADAYRQLATLAENLSRIEPHSPIPDLLRWAVHLGGLPFRDLIQEFVREPSVLQDIRRQFGIKEPEATQ